MKISIIFTVANNGENWSALYIPVKPVRFQSCMTISGHIMKCDTDGWIKTCSALPLGVHNLDTIILLK